MSAVKRIIVGCAGGIMLALLLLVVGYYLGYLHASTLFMDYLRSEMLSDRISAAIYLRYGDAQAAPAAESSGLPENSALTDLDGDTVLSAPQLADEGAPLSSLETPIPSPQRYEAHLIGFGSLSKAERYVAHLAQLGVSAHVRTRIHRARKKRITWYQVVSAPAPYHDLLALVDMLKKLDKLAGVVLVEVEQEEISS